MLITGASSGIGAATARAAAKKAARTILLARTRPKLDALVAEILADGGQARAYEVDCGDREAVARVAQQIEDEVGTPDVIVNNAGAGRFLFLEETPPEEFEQMMAAPFFAAVYVTRAFLPAMVERDRGVIININSPVAFVAWPGAAGYAAARWALRGFNDALRTDLHGTGVNVCHVLPARVASPYLEHNPGAAEGIPTIAKIMRMLSPEDVADVIVKTIEHERPLVFAPFMLRLVMFQARLFPRLTEWLTVKTAKPRPQPRTPAL